MDKLLQETNLTLESIQAVVISAGPGSFTGLRIGFSLAKGLCHTLRIPIIAIPTLDVLAYQVGETPATILTVIDAHRGEVFWKAFQWHNHRLKAFNEIQLSTVEKMKPFADNDHLICVGPELPKFIPQLQNLFSSHSCLFLQMQPSVLALLQLGFQRYTQREFDSLSEIEPLYVRTFKGIR